MDQPSRVDASVYFDVFRRLWWLIVLSIFGVTGFLLIRSNATDKSGSEPAVSLVALYQESIDLLFVNQSMGNTVVQQSPNDIALRMQSTDIVELVEAKTGKKSKITFTAESEHLKFVVESLERSTAQEAADEYISLIQTYRKDSLIKFATFNLGVKNEELKNAVAVANELESKIAATNSPAIAAALTLERAAIIPQIEGLRSSIGTFNGIVKSATGQVDVVSRITSDPKGLFTPVIDTRLTTWSANTRAVVFGIALGFLLGCVLLIFALMFDRRLRRSSDVPLIIGSVPTLGGLSKIASAFEKQQLIVAVRNALDVSSLQNVQLVPLSVGVDTKTVGEVLKAGLSATSIVNLLEVVDELTINELEPQKNTGVVFVAEFGKSSKSDLQRSALIMSRAGHHIIGIIFSSVSKQGLSNLFK
ncbi:MAG: hypothetical protein HQ486_00985 [Acidimicrobiaceae bacterium]|nr:hypothetical protein [Acidimicrobiaceae bacterium]